MKAFLVKLFISRAAPALTQYAGKLLANGAVAGGVWLTSHGVQAGDSLSVIAGGLATLVGAGVEYIRIHYGDAVAETVANPPK